jgi:hypothetical protein
MLVLTPDYDSWHDSPIIPRMLSEMTAGFLSALTYQGDAQRQVCWLPLGGIHWEDEIPDIRHLMKLPQDDRNQIFRLFCIRVRLWKGEALTDAQRQFWDMTHSQVPGWAFFQRQQISDDDLHAQENAEWATTDALEVLFADAHEVSVSEEDGVESFSATFRLTKEQIADRKPWRERLFRKRRLEG